jgi:replicative DNA helicase
MKDNREKKSYNDSIENEKLVLGCMLCNENNINIGMGILKSQDFYYIYHQDIFNSLQELYKEDKPGDIHLVAEKLKKKNKYNSVGGIRYLIELSQYAGTSVYIEEYIQVLKEKSMLRKLILCAKETLRQANEYPNEVKKCLENAQKSLFEISEEEICKEEKHIKDISLGKFSKSNNSYLKDLEERQKNYLEGGVSDLYYTSFPSGFNSLDNKIKGLAPSNLIIVGGRPGMGKTSFLLNIVEHVAFKEKKNVVIYSLEMSFEQIFHRMICSQAEIEGDKLITGNLTEENLQQVKEKIEMIQNSNVIIDDRTGLDIFSLKGRARRLKEVYNIDLLVIDYLQLIRSEKRNSNRQEEISEISRELKILAKDLNIPIICASQLSRKVEERSDKTPVMSDLRESGAVEQDADNVIIKILYYYFKLYNYIYIVLIKILYYKTYI